MVLREYRFLILPAREEINGGLLKMSGAFPADQRLDNREDRGIMEEIHGQEEILVGQAFAIQAPPARRQADRLSYRVGYAGRHDRRRPVYPPMPEMVRRRMHPAAFGVTFRWGVGVALTESWETRKMAA
jgi:hypothetical protein